MSNHEQLKHLDLAAADESVNLVIRRFCIYGPGDVILGRCKRLTKTLMATSVPIRGVFTLTGDFRIIVFRLV